MQKIHIDPEELYNPSPLLTGIMDLAFDGSMLMDKNGILLHCSASQPLMFGVPNEESVGRHITEMDSASPYPQLLADGKAVLGGIHIINGITCLTNMIPLFDEEDNIVGAFGNITLRGIEKIKDLVKENVLRGEGSELYSQLSRAEAKYSLIDFIGQSPAVREVLELTRRAARYDYPVLITGETGCGKELIASGIHTESAKKARKPFIRINCTAIPHDLLESELFGYEKGAFTGAVTTKHGKFEIAGDGTILLDEIGDLNASMQSKLLRVIEEREFERLGGNKLIPLYARVIASTNCDLEALMREGRFRQDLYYRLSSVEIKIPPLRQRPEDIPLLLAHFAGQQGVDITFAPDAIDLLCAYSWPGNVRELRNMINRLSIAGETRADGELLLRLFDNLRAQGHPGSSAPAPGSLREGERAQVLEALTRHGLSVSAAARALGISRSTLYGKIKKYGIRTKREIAE